MPIIIGIVVILLLLAVFVVVIYNGLVALRNQVQNSWAQIDVELQRRFDLIPNLVETVKGYMEHETAVLTKVAELRTSWANASSISEKVNLGNELSNTLKSIMAVAEGYPDLKANANFVALQDELSNTENKISSSRKMYNDSVTKYNTKLDIFPSNIIGGMFNFKHADLFEIDDDAKRENVKVEF